VTKDLEDKIALKKGNSGAVKKVVAQEKVEVKE
jgi:hypothetical protein